jgi:ABC-2 type transport system ATP-binding protein
MREGRILADGTPTEIKQRAGVDDVEAAFLALVRKDAA